MSVFEPTKVVSAPVTPGQPVAIVIVGYRNPEDICACLTALQKSSETNFIISICENGGREAFGKLISEIQGLVEPSNEIPEILDERVTKAWVGRLRPDGQTVHVYLAQANLGFAGGVNVGLRQLARSPYWSAIWLLNPDAEPTPGALKALIDHANQGGYAVVGSRLVSKSMRKVQQYGGRWRPLIGRGFNIGMGADQDATADVADIERSITYVSGASLYATRAYCDAVGFMQEDYFLYAEDVDWCLRGAGRLFGYAHNALVYHKHGSTIGSNSNRKLRSRLSVYLDERNKLLLTRQFLPKIFPVVAITTFLLTTQYLLEGAPGNFLVALSGWFAGVRGERGPPKFIVDAGTNSLSRGRRSNAVAVSQNGGKPIRAVHRDRRGI